MAIRRTLVRSGELLAVVVVLTLLVGQHVADDGTR
jgi:hypothetical protein